MADWSVGSLGREEEKVPCGMDGPVRADDADGCGEAVVGTAVEAGADAVAGVSAAFGAVAIVPVPLRAAVCGEPVALSATETDALALAAVVGVKVTEIVQLAPTASVGPQVLV